MYFGAYVGTAVKRLQKDDEILLPLKTIHITPKSPPSHKQTYTLLNFFRGCHYLLSNPTFSQFCSHQMLPLMSHDPLFLLPLPIILLNYLILSKSRHPFLIHMVRKQNKMMCFTLAFMSGLLFAPLPSIYPLAYIGVGLGHLTVRGCKNRMEEWG